MARGTHAWLQPGAGCHSFWAGYAAARLPPATFEPVGISFVGASMASPGTMEANEHRLPKDHPLRSLFLVERANRPADRPEWTYNMLLKHGVRSCLEYARSGRQGIDTYLDGSSSDFGTAAVRASYESCATAGGGRPVARASH